MTDSGQELTVFRGYKTELDPNRDQIALFTKCSGAARWTYNWGLQRKIETYRETGKTLTRFDLEKELARRKRSDSPWLAQVSSRAPGEAVKDLETAFQRFFRGRQESRRYVFPQDNASHDGLGRIRCT